MAIQERDERVGAFKVQLIPTHLVRHDHPLTLYILLDHIQFRM